MIPTREQFKEFMAFVQNAQEKEDKVNDAFELIWDDEQAQHVPFYISPWWKVVRYAFCPLFNLKFNKLGIDDVLEWWMEEAPKGEAKYWIDEKEYNVSDIDVYYDYLAEMSIEPNKKQNNELQFQSRAYILHFGHPFQSREHYQVLQPAIQGCRTYE